MNERQRDSLIKYAFDITKMLLLGILIWAYFAPTHAGSMSPYELTLLVISIVAIVASVAYFAIKYVVLKRRR